MQVLRIPKPQKYIELLSMDRFFLLRTSHIVCTALEANYGRTRKCKYPQNIKEKLIVYLLSVFFLNKAFEDV